MNGRDVETGKWYVKPFFDVRSHPSGTRARFDPSNGVGLARQFGQLVVGPWISKRAPLEEQLLVQFVRVKRI